MTKGEAYNKGVRKNQLAGSYGDFSPVEVKSSGSRYPVDLVYFKTSEAEDKVYYSTQKPVELGKYLIRTYPNENDLILDNTCGSGSFLVFAILENIKFIGFEKNKDVKLYKDKEVDLIEISNSRINNALNNHNNVQKTLFD